MILSLLIVWLAFAAGIAWPLKRLHFISGHWADWPTAIAFGLLWPLWIVLQVRKRLLEAMIGKR